MSAPVIHYAGALAWVRGKTLVQIAAGYAACCTGEKATKIMERGAHTYIATDVTCKACLGCIEKAARRPKTRPGLPR